MLHPCIIYALHLGDMEDIPKQAIADGRRLLPGRGVVPLNESCSRLKAVGYNGLCSVELFRAKYCRWDPCNLAAKAHQTATQTLSPHFRLE